MMCSVLLTESPREWVSRGGGRGRDGHRRRGEASKGEKGKGDNLHSKGDN
jgi:hypothetical protein